MTNIVTFPGLGLEFHLDRVAFSLFGHPVYWYGVIIGCGFLLAIGLGALFVPYIFFQLLFTILQRYDGLTVIYFIASFDKSAHARRTFRHAFRGVIALDVQPVCLRALFKRR